MKLILYVFLLLNIFFIHNVFAGGFDYNTTFGSRTFTLNGLYFAGSPGLSSIYSNPAGLNKLQGAAIELSLIDRVEQNEFESSARGNFKSYRDENFSMGGGFYWKFSENFTVGAAYHPLIDYRTDWPSAVYRNIDTADALDAFSMLHRLEINSISPAVAFRFGSLQLALAGNIYQVISQINFPRINENWGQVPSLAAYQFEYKFDAWSYGATLGLIYDFSEKLTMGFMARSGFKADLEGEAESRMFTELNSAASIVDASTEFEIPWKFGLGFLYSLTPSTFINIDAAYSLWGAAQENINVIFEDQTWQNRTSEMDSLSGFAANTIPLNSDNSIDLGIGIEHFSQGGVIYRAGYRFSQSPINEASYNFLLPLVDQHIISVGIGYKDENLTIDAGIAYTFGPLKKIESSENRYMFGEYSTDSYIPSLTLRYELK